MIQQSDTRARLLKIMSQQHSNSIIIFDGKSWSTKNSKLNKIPFSTYLETACYIVNELNDTSNETHIPLQDTIQYVSRFNDAWTSAALSQKYISSVRNESQVQFSSHCSKFNWLSNMFTTIIVDVEKQRASVEC